MKNVPVLLFQTDCSNPSAAAPPTPSVLMFVWVIAAGAVPFVVEKSVPNAGEAALFAVSRILLFAGFALPVPLNAISSTRVSGGGAVAVAMDCSRIGAAGLVTL